jgi:drug/metabolite transporter (DMT)-like permease
MMNGMYLRLFASTFLWGTVFHVGKFAMQQFSPLTVISWRNGVAALVLTGLSFGALRANWRQIRARLTALLALSLTGVLGFGVLMFYGLRLTSPVNAALIMAFNPAMIAVMSALLNREKIHLQQIAGLLAGLCGVLVVVSHGSLAALLSLRVSSGDLLVGLSSLCWAGYCVLPKRLVPEIPSAQLSTITITIGAAAILLLAAWTAPDLGVMPDGKMLLILLFLGLFGTVIPYLWWNQGVQKLGPAKAGIFMNLVPIFASVVSVLIGQSMSGSQIVGATLVIVGVLLTSIKIR